MAYIKIDTTGRITAASNDFHCGDGEIEVEIPEEIEMKDVYEYRYVDGEFVHDPLPTEKPKATQLDVIEAQVTYTAMMTDTLLEV